MKYILYRRQYLALRIIISLAIQILLVVLLSRPHDSIGSPGILITAVVASASLAVSPCQLSLRNLVLLWLVGLFPQFAILATAVHLLGWHGWFNWLHRVCASLVALL
jgi:hypothetical protein